jgi:hypothetical protein
MRINVNVGYERTYFTVHVRLEFVRYCCSCYFLKYFLFKNKLK